VTFSRPHSGGSLKKVDFGGIFAPRPVPSPGFPRSRGDPTCPPKASGNPRFQGFSARPPTMEGNCKACPTPQVDAFSATGIELTHWGESKTQHSNFPVSVAIEQLNKSRPQEPRKPTDNPPMHIPEKNPPQSRILSHQYENTIPPSLASGDVFPGTRASHVTT
jgi:hypothetical protein